MIQEYEHFTDEGGRATALISFWGNLNQKQQKRKPANLGWALQENINKINYNYSFNRQNQNSNSNFQKFNSSKKIQKVPFNQIQNEIQTRRNQNQLKFGKNKTIGNKKPSRIDENQVKYHESIDQKCTNNQDVQCKENKEQKVESQDSSCNVQKLVSMFENKSVVDRTYSEQEKCSSIKKVELKRSFSVQSSWSCVGQAYQNLPYKSYVDDTRSVSSVGSNRMVNSRQHEGEDGAGEASSGWECEGQSQNSDRSESYQVLVTRYADGGIEGVVIQNDFSTFSESSS
eukprot:TRINITY_DN19323_c1_g1_i3.p1 TRINITY_DN19323_c1_g1~~TRINITY_DN19323_c1_g1_i3.p1  ORF type:complete len:286 (-),score=25.85 TRINITY_DN19323_c1_g1_i3:667-1524(-)